MLAKSDFIKLNKNMLEIAIRVELISLKARREISENHNSIQMIIETEMLSAQIDSLEKSLAEVRSY